MDYISKAAGWLKYTPGDGRGHVSTFETGDKLSPFYMRKVRRNDTPLQNKGMTKLQERYDDIAQSPINIDSITGSLQDVCEPSPLSGEAVKETTPSDTPDCPDGDTPPARLDTTGAHGEYVKRFRAWCNGRSDRKTVSQARVNITHFFRFVLISVFCFGGKILKILKNAAKTH